MSHARRIGAIVGTAVAMLGVGCSCASAATVTVPAGDASALVAAITTANANGEADTLRISGRYALSAADNHWYGANVLPAIRSDITIVGDDETGATIEGTTGYRGRLFYVSGGRSGLSAGTLRLRDLELRGGRARGGNASFGGGGAGMGGAVFNQGTLTLERVTLADNQAIGGSTTAINSTGGGGMGQDAQDPGGGGGFGGPVSGGGSGGAGGAAAGGVGGGGGGGGGYEAGENGASGGTPAGGTGGGTTNGQGGASTGGALGGRGTGAGGRSVSGLNAGTGGAGGAFGSGGSMGTIATNRGAGGGGGVGGGGGGAGPGAGGGGGGFGGGGGWANINGGDGGFGGGAGGVDARNPGQSAARGGFGGGDASVPVTDMITAGGGGAGMGGGIFNDGGTVTAVNSTFSGNAATGGSSTAAFIGGIGLASEGGDGLGSALFNLNGSVSLSHVTVAGNTATGGTGLVNGNAGTAVANVAYDRATARTSTVTVDGSALEAVPTTTVPGTTADGGANLSSGSAPITDTTTSSLGLAPLGDYGGPTATMAPAPTSSLIDAVTGVDTTAEDQRGFPRSAPRDRGAIETVATSLDVADRTITASASAQNVSLSTTIVRPRGGTSPGAVTFGVTGIAGSISPTIAGGSASGTFSVPGGTAPGTYTITAAAAAAPGFRSGTGSGTLRILRPAPVCSNVTADAAYDTAVTVDPDCAGTLAGDDVEIVDDPDHGTAQVVSGRLEYEPTAGHVGQDSFTYTVTNEGGTSNTATVTVTVAPAKPTCHELDVDTGSGKGKAITLACTSAIAQTYAVVDPPEHGTLSGLDPVAGTVTYTSDAGYDGPDAFTYRSTNSSGAAVAATVDVDVHPAPTVAVTPSSDVELGDGSLTASATVNGRYAPTAGATVDFRLYGPDDATCSETPVYEDLAVAYPLAGGAVAAGSFTPTAVGVHRWRVSYSGDATNVGATSGCDAASVTVLPAKPTCDGLDLDAGSGKGTTVTLACASTIAQTYAVVDAPEHGTLSDVDLDAGTAVYTSDAGYVGTDRFTYRSTNATGDAVVAEVEIEVHAAPTVTVTASDDIELGSGVLTATASVDGRYAPDAGATIDVRLYGPDDATCSGAPVYERLGVDYPVTGGPVDAGRFTPAAAGVYRWRVAYSGDLRNVGGASGCDAASVTVTARPVVPPVQEPPVPEPTASAPPSPDQCGAELVLLDVAPATKGQKARVSGIAGPKLAGERVTILRNGRSVGTTRVAANGVWSATVAGPGSARSRPWYAATTTRTRTGSLRYFRRMTIESRRGLRATGRITSPASLRPKTVRIDRIDVCSGRRTATTAKVSRAGAFTVRLAPPAANEPYALFRVSAALADRSQTYTTMLAVPR